MTVYIPTKKQIREAKKEIHKQRAIEKGQNHTQQRKAQPRIYRDPFKGLYATQD